MGKKGTNIKGRRLGVTEELNTFKEERNGGNKDRGVEWRGEERRGEGT
jgi:hypothetical protein